MKTLIASITLLLSVNVFALSECKEVVGDSPYKGEITEVSRELSFNNCPESVLVNGKYVARLILVDSESETRSCSYQFGMVAFTCANN